MGLFSRREKEEFIPSRITELQEGMSDIMIKYNDKTITKEDLKEFCCLLIEYCKLTKYAELSLDIPKARFQELDIDVQGSYYRRTNEITISELYLDEILEGKARLIELIDTIGHEMTHYSQNSETKRYDELTAEEQQKVDSESKKIIDSYRNYLNLDRNDIRVLHDLLAPYLKKDEIPSGYTAEEQFYEDISFSLYYTILVEQEARLEGYSFATDFIHTFLQISRNKKLKKTLTEERIYIEGERDKESRQDNHAKKNIECFF